MAISTNVKKRFHWLLPLILLSSLTNHESFAAAMTEDEMRDSALNLLHNEFHVNSDPPRRWTKIKELEDFDRYQCDQEYCTPGDEVCWRVVVHVYSEELRFFDKIYVYDGDRASNHPNDLFLGASIFLGGAPFTDYDLVTEEDMVRPYCTNYCNPYLFQTDKTVIMRYKRGQGKSLRLNPDAQHLVDGNGVVGIFAEWVAKIWNDQVRFMSTKTGKFLYFDRNNEVHADGLGGSWSKFKVSLHSEGYATFESLQWPGKYLCVEDSDLSVFVGLGGHREPGGACRFYAYHD